MFISCCLEQMGDIDFSLDNRRIGRELFRAIENESRPDFIRSALLYVIDELPREPTSEDVLTMLARLAQADRRRTDDRP